MNRLEMRARIRRDLHDEDPAAYRWTDDEIDRHIARALADLTLAVPREAKALLTVGAGARDLSLAALSDRIGVEAVEYPTGNYPPSHVPFSIWGDTLTLLVDAPPASSQEVAVYYTCAHVLDVAGSTIPPALEDLVATGAAGFAALEWASFAVNRLNAGGDDTWRRYLIWGQERLAAFNAALARHARGNTVPARRLYAPAAPLDSQEQVTGR